MQKDFDAWNREKTNIDHTNLHKFYHPRDIWWCALGVNVGYEQDGTGITHERPVLVLKGFSKQVCLIVPLTTSQKKNPYHISLGIIDQKPASAIISQVRLIDTKRFSNKIGVLDAALFAEIKKSSGNYSNNFFVLPLLQGQARRHLYTDCIPSLVFCQEKYCLN